MKRFTAKDIWVLIVRILIFEVFFGISVTTLNLLLDLEIIFKNIHLFGFISFEIFALIVIVIFEFVGIIEIYMIWFHKYGRRKLKGKEKIIDLVKKGEGRKIEFKKSLRWDFQMKNVNKELERSILKTIAGFLNSDGGTLLLGVSDNRMVNGLKEDYLTLPRKDRDGFENYLVQLIRSYLGTQTLRLIKISFYDFDGRDVCRISVSNSNEPVFVKTNGMEEFFVRGANSTASLSISESVKYISARWKTDSNTNK